MGFEPPVVEMTLDELPNFLLLLFDRTRGIDLS
jgi:hypothetical protein